MNFLIIGLGSMGKRRIRCLKALGFGDYITGFDIREDRRKEAHDHYNIPVIGNLEEKSLGRFDCLIISVPPDKHAEYIRLAIICGIPAFVEASVNIEGLEELNVLAKKAGVFIAPSCTMLFHPAIKDIKRILQSGEFGKITNFSYHSGQYLPDWHPWERVTDYYVSNRETGGGREIVPFELTWIVDLMGFPQKVSGFFGKTLDVGADIDDTYVIGMDFGTFFGALTVDVVARFATRSLILNLENAQILWNWNEHQIKIYDANNLRWVSYQHPEGISIAGYNKNIIDDMYVEELKSFINRVRDKTTYPNSLDKDIAVLKILNRAEGKI
ncbi:Gfo/Idh/MocA family protein [Methanoregula sp. UBA64]|uniref:Gfo/Idh/MocA family protein n=1 Tax=Methanoregula sp. UBA64 TaxID=1915554 RepID=UPI0025EFE3BA|nr:Gfo/Idh/MocA family oxidoreductase [Methanoregula sp. UBA64]